MPLPRFPSQIRKIIGALPPDTTFVTASTGVAAYQIGGVTLHAFAGIGNAAQTTEQCVEMAQVGRARRRGESSVLLERERQGKMRAFEPIAD